MDLATSLKKGFQFISDFKNLPKLNTMDITNFFADNKKNIKLSEINTDDTGKYNSKEEAVEKLNENIDKMTDLQEKLYAQDKYSLLIILQAMDTAGKDGIVKHVMKGLNPQGTNVHSFKQPSAEDLDHDYLWRANKNLPERGQIGIFNRSYYEEVLVVRVHDLVKTQQIPNEFITDDIWKNRYRQIRDYEKYLDENGTVIIKIFLHISKDEQRNRLLERIEDKSKNWKFSPADIKERGFWDDYQKVYEDAISETTTKYSPWYVVPANKKWYARLVVSEIIVQTMEHLELKYPEISVEQTKLLEDYRQKLVDEKI
jgi:PPK2 family polyphosphate:nucleotide phosphotransferase